MIASIRVLLLCCVALALAPASSAQADPRLAAAEQAYRDGRYAEAERVWRDLAAGPWGADGRLHYDLGNAAYRQGHFAAAVLAYERALRRPGAGPEVRFNRDLALQRLRVPARGGGGLVEGFRTWLRDLDAGSWFRLGLGCQALALLLLMAALAGRGRRTLWAVVTLWGLGLFAQVRAADVDPDRPVGVVVLEDRAPLRAEPRAGLEPILRLPAGQRARWLGGTRDWLRVSVTTPDGPREGWLPAGAAGTY
ncbi:MAG: hypothetical protein R3F30_10220 [Planctomycetota bacterium]